MRRSPPCCWPLCPGLLCLSLVMLGWAAEVQGEAFGRWETKLEACTMQQGPVGLPLQAQRQSCGRLRLEQNLEGLLSVRLITPSGSQLFGSQTLVFGGQLAAGQRPMRCSADGHCKPRWPIRLEVATVASSLVRKEGLAPTIPLAQMARGTCLLERWSLKCQARDQQGQFWEAQASF